VTVRADPAVDPELLGLVDVARRLYGATHAHLDLVGPAGPWRAVTSGPQLPEGAARALAEEVLKSGAPIAVADTSADARCSGDPLRSGRAPVRSWAGAPLLDAADRALGVLAVCTSRPDPLPQPPLDGLATLARAAAARVERLDLVTVAPAPAPPKRPTPRRRTTDPRPTLADRGGLVAATRSALEQLRRGGSGSVAVLVLRVHPDTPRSLASAEVTRLLQAELRPSDVLCRTRPDAYVVLLDELPAGAPYVALGVADRLSQALTAALQPGGPPVASTGLACCTPSADDARVDAELLMARAEQSASIAHRLGGGRFHIHRATGPRPPADDGQIEQLLRASLDEGSLVVHYQPVVDLATRVIVGVEALVRLRGADGVLVAPDRFIAVAERSGLVGALGEQVRQEAMETVAAWKRALPDGRHFGLGVNLSVGELAGRGLVQSVQQSLRTSGLEPSALNLEITESAFMEEGRGHERVLSELRETGARLYLDDFGTGFSSLSYLRRFPVDGLKIDRTFVADLASGTHSGTLTAAIVHLARELGVGVVAEGVETEEQAQALLDHGCRLAQGYLLARPAPAEVVQALLLPAPRLPRDAGARNAPEAAGRVD